MSTIVGNDNLRNLWERLSTDRADHAFMEFQNREGERQAFTYAEFDRYINRTANYFLSLGVKKGDNVAIQLYNSPESVSTAMALAKIGAVAVPVNMAHMVDECAFVYEKCGIDMVVAEPDCQPFYISDVPEGVEWRNPAPARIEEVCPMRRVLISHLRGGEPLLDGATDFDAGVAECSDVLEDCCELSALDTAMIIFTSGTTSRPKGVELTHGNMLFGGYFGIWQCGLTPEDRLLTTMPAFHSNFQTAALMPALVAGATLVFIEKYSARRYWKQVREYRATSLQLTAMIARTMMVQPIDEGERDHQVRSIQYYLAITDEEKDAFEDRFGVRLMNCYGSTESVCWVLTDLPFGERRWPSVGRAGLGYQVEIVDDDGHAVESGCMGEIVVHGIPGITLMKGYYDEPEITAETVDSDGWMHTGDKGYRDEEGWFYFVDRKSNMIKRSGENISASEVEGVLASHPDIAEAAVIGVPDPVRDQAVKAFLIPEKGCVLDRGEVVGYCKGRLAGFKIPSIIEVVDDLPRTSVGKIAKKLLS